VRKVTFHDLRHTTATLLAGLGTHSVIIQTLMRHSSLEQAMEYVGLVCGKKDAAVARMAFGFEFDSGGTAFAPAAEPASLSARAKKGPGGDQMTNRRKAALEHQENPKKVRRFQESGREDLNLRPPAPKAGALPGCATPRVGQE
jgi:hypothetical protein